MANCQCNEYITLRWLNSLGGWEYWTFDARHTYGYNISNVKDFNVDIFDNWDDDFITGEAEQKTLTLDAAETIVLRTTSITKDQVNGLATLPTSINIQTADNNQTVSINRNSFQYRTDREKNITISFTITKPRLQIQTL